MASAIEDFNFFQKSVVPMDCVYVLTIYVFTCLHILFHSSKPICFVSCYTDICLLKIKKIIKIILLLTQCFYTNSAEEAFFRYIGPFLPA